MTTRDVVQSILNGECDENLNGVREALRQREQALAVMLTATLTPGDKVRIKRGSIKPKYLGGEIATVSRVEGGRVYANLDAEEYQSGRYSGEVGLPLATIERVSS